MMLSGWKGYAAGILLILIATVGFFLGKLDWTQAGVVASVGLGIWGIRDKQQRDSLLPVLLLAVLLALPACSAPGTGGETSPNTASTATGGYVGAGGEQRAAGATYLIRSTGTTYNIDTDGSPAGAEAAEAIAEALQAYDHELAGIREDLGREGISAEERADLRDLLRFVTTEKRLFMEQAKGAFGVSIVVESKGEGHGSSTVDTAGTTGQDNAVPPATDVPPPPKEEAPDGLPPLTILGWIFGL